MRDAYALTARARERFFPNPEDTDSAAHSAFALWARNGPPLPDKIRLSSSPWSRTLTSQGHIDQPDRPDLEKRPMRDCTDRPPQEICD